MPVNIPAACCVYGAALVIAAQSQFHNCLHSLVLRTRVRANEKNMHVYMYVEGPPLLLLSVYFKCKSSRKTNKQNLHQYTQQYWRMDKIVEGDQLDENVRVLCIGVVNESESN